MTTIYAETDPFVASGRERARMIATGMISFTTPANFPGVALTADQLAKRGYVDAAGAKRRYEAKPHIGTNSGTPDIHHNGNGSVTSDTVKPTPH